MLEIGLRKDKLLNFIAVLPSSTILPKNDTYSVLAKRLFQQLSKYFKNCQDCILVSDTSFPYFVYLRFS